MIKRLAQTLRAASWIERTIWLLTAIALGMTAYYIVILLITQQVFSGIPAIFWIIGRAINSGYTLYVDIFETKPPLIFLLSAASYKLFDSPVLGTVYHTILLFAVLVATVWYAHRRLHESHGKSVALLLAALLFSSLIIRFITPHPTAWAIEFYGLATCCLYFVVLADMRKISAWRVAVLTILLGLSIGMKESFLLSALAGALVLCKSRKEFVWGFVVPVLITGVVGVLVLLSLGSLGAYISIYLPEMFGYYTQRFYMPFLLKGLVFDKIFESINVFSSSFLIFSLGLFVAPQMLSLAASGRRILERWVLIISIVCVVSLYSATSFFFKTSQGVLILLILLALYRRFWKKERHRSDIAAVFAAASMLGMRFACEGFRIISALFGRQLPSSVCVTGVAISLLITTMGLCTVWAVLAAVRSHRDEDRPRRLLQAALLLSIFVFYSIILLSFQVSFWWTRIVFPLMVLGIAIYAYRQRKTEEGIILKTFGLTCTAFYIAAFAVSMGSDFQHHHFLSFVPLLFALFLLVVDRLAALSSRPRLLLFWLGAIALIVVCNPLRNLAIDKPWEAIAASDAQLEAYRKDGAGIDAILDACKIERYFVMDAGDTYAYTKHIPQNFFLWAGLEALNHDPAVRKLTIQSIVNSDIVFIGANTPSPDKLSAAQKGTLEYISKRFSEKPWPCAEGVTPQPDLFVVYRQERAGKRMEQLELPIK